jgi:alkanesulfonate monooxygenase SsuD/methylene tetrahydromethanopterin reductase-like flavin-dependent oxidoreductase (luciferase family)
VLASNAAVLPDSIFFSEQVSAAYPYTADGVRMWDASTPWIDPLVGAAAMAAATRRLFFYTSVVKLPVRNALLMARQILSVASISGDRFGFGAGLGWLPEESRWCGAPFEGRGARMDEALAVLKLLFTGEMVEFHGQHFDFGKLQMSPRPGKPIPIYIGGHTEPALKRAVKYDGWSSAMLSSDELIAIAGKLRALRHEVGRGDAPFEVQGVAMDAYRPEHFRKLEAGGVTDVILLPWLFYGVPIRGGSLQSKIDGIRKFADEVIARL